VAKRRARLNEENDPLSSTDKVLAGFEQLSQSASQPDDKFHLQLQLELGKGSAPYKEVIVEEALARLLEQAQENPEELIAVLRQRQEKRK
jgi:hypothetical protein